MRLVFNFESAVCKVKKCTFKVQDVLQLRVTVREGVSLLIYPVLKNWSVNQTSQTEINIDRNRQKMTMTLLPQELLSHIIIVRILTTGSKIYKHRLRLSVNYIDSLDVHHKCHICIYVRNPTRPVAGNEFC